MAESLFPFRLSRSAITGCFFDRHFQTKADHRSSEAPGLPLDLRSFIRRLLGDGDRMASDEVVKLRPAAELALTMAKGPLAPNSALLTDTYTSPLRAQRGAAKRGR